MDELTMETPNKLPIVALITCIFVGYMLKPGTLEAEIEHNGKFAGRKLFNAVIRYIAPICIVLILIYSVLSAFGIMPL